MVQSGPGFGNGGGVAQHANSSLDFGQVTTWNNCWWLVVDANLETGWAPVNELDGSFGLDGGDGRVNVFWYNITSVQQAAGHVFSVSWIAFDHLVGWLEASVGDFRDGELLVVGFFGRDDWSVSGQWEMDSWVGDQVSLELGKIDVQSTIESERCGDGTDNLSDQPVQVGVGWSFNVQVSSTDVVDGFVVNHESTVGVLQSGVGGQNGVVWLNNSGGDLWSWVDGKFQFGFLSIINRQSFHQQTGETRSGTATKGVEDEKTLETGALISEFSGSIKDQIDQFFTNGVMASGVVVGGIFFTGDQLFWVE